MTSCKRKSIVIGLVFGDLDEAHASFPHDDIAERDADSDNFYRLVVGYVRAYSLSV